MPLPAVRWHGPECEGVTRRELKEQEHLPVFYPHRSSEDREENEVDLSILKCSSRHLGLRLRASL